MVAVVENRTAVVAVVEGQRDVDEVLVELVLDVTEAGPVEGYPDLVSGQTGRWSCGRAARSCRPGSSSAAACAGRSPSRVRGSSASSRRRRTRPS